jgi:hypothetical protein
MTLGRDKSGWLDRFRLGDHTLVIHCIFNTPFDILNL